MQQCAASTGIPIGLIKRAKKAGCSAFKSNRVDLRLLLPAVIGAQGPDWGEEDRKWSAEARKLKFQKDQERFWEKDEVDQAIAAAVGVLFREIDRLFNIELPPQIKGLDEIGCQKHMLDGAERCKRVLKAELKKFASL